MIKNSTPRIVKIFSRQGDLVGLLWKGSVATLKKCTNKLADSVSDPGRGSGAETMSISI